MFSNKIVQLTITMAVLAFSYDAFSQCTMDTDCKGDRVCQDGVCVSPESANDAQLTTRFDYKLNVGLFGGVTFPGPGEVWVGPGEGSYHAPSAGFISGLTADGRVFRYLSVGVFTNLGIVGAEDMDGQPFRVFILGASFKGRIPLHEMFELRIGVGLALNIISHEDIEDTSKGFNPSAIFEGVIPFHKHVAAMIHFSFISQPVGGTGDVEITFAPIMYLAAGIEFHI